jgi:hypothetical protein
VPKPEVIRGGEPLRLGDRLLLPGGDARQALWLANQICDSDEETSAYLEWLRQRTLNLIREKTFGPAVRAVTDELLSHRELSYRRVKEIATASLRLFLGSRP